MLWISHVHLVHFAMRILYGVRGTCTYSIHCFAIPHQRHVDLTLALTFWLLIFLDKINPRTHVFFAFLRSWTDVKFKHHKLWRERKSPRLRNWNSFFFRVATDATFSCIVVVFIGYENLNRRTTATNDTYGVSLCVSCCCCCCNATTIKIVFGRGKNDSLNDCLHVYRTTTTATKARPTRIWVKKIKNYFDFCVHSFHTHKITSHYSTLHGVVEANIPLYRNSSPSQQLNGSRFLHSIHYDDDRPYAAGFVKIVLYSDLHAQLSHTNRRDVFWLCVSSQTTAAQT